MACEICQKPYVSATEESSFDSDVKPHVCNICGRSFSLKIQLKRHVLTHAGGAPYICNSCEKNSEYKDFKSYNLRLTKQNNYICDICSKSFSTKRLLLRHSRKHTFDETYNYDEHEESFENVIALKRHSVIHKAKRSNAKNNSKKLPTEMYTCEECGKSFAYMQNLEKHSLTHKKHICKGCKKSFVYKAALKKHKLKCKNVNGKDNADFSNQNSSDVNTPGTPERKHICELCGKSFARKSSLEGHLITHQDDSFDSPVEEEFSDTDASYHGSDDYNAYPKKIRLPKLKLNKSFSCESCDEVCTSKRALNKHRLSHNATKTEAKLEERVEDNSFSSFLCDNGINSKDPKNHNLSNDKKEVKEKSVDKGQKTYPCEMCNKIFFRKSRLKKHHVLFHDEDKPDQDLLNSDSAQASDSFVIKRKRSKKFGCDVCGKRFAGETCLKKHVSKHTEEEVNGDPVITARRRKKKVQTLVCEFCNAEFTGKKSVFEKHRHSHTPEVCGICDERFVDRQSLREHCRIHVGTEVGRRFMECSQKALDAKNGILPPEPKVEYIYLVLR